MIETELIREETIDELMARLGSDLARRNTKVVTKFKPDFEIKKDTKRLKKECEIAYNKLNDILGSIKVVVKEIKKVETSIKDEIVLMTYPDYLILCACTVFGTTRESINLKDRSIVNVNARNYIWADMKKRHDKTTLRELGELFDCEPFTHSNVFTGINKLDTLKESNTKFRVKCAHLDSLIDNFLIQE